MKNINYLQLLKCEYLSSSKKLDKKKFEDITVGFGKS